MNKTEYKALKLRLLQLVADTSGIAHDLRNSRMTVLADRILTTCTTAGLVLDHYNKVEPDWDAPDSSDCHTHS